MFAPTGVSLGLVRLRPRSRARGVADHGPVRPARVAERPARRRARRSRRGPRTSCATGSRTGSGRCSLGGCLFGFSAYMSSNVNGGFVNLVLVFPIPLLVYLAIRNVEGSLGPVAFVAGFTALLVGLFSISTELFGTATVFGAIAFLGALAFAKETPPPAAAHRRPGAPCPERSPRSCSCRTSTRSSWMPPTHPFAKPSESSPDLTSLIVPPPVIRAGGSDLEPTLESLMEYPQSNGQSYLGVAVLRDAGGLRDHRAPPPKHVGTASVRGLVRDPHPGSRPAYRRTSPTMDRSRSARFSHLPFLASAVPARLAVYSTPRDRRHRGALARGKRPPRRPDPMGDSRWS